MVHSAGVRALLSTARLRHACVQCSMTALHYRQYSWVAQQAASSRSIPPHLKAAKKPDLASTLLARWCLMAASMGAAASWVATQ